MVKKLLVKNITEILPGLRNSEFDWIKFYGEIALNGGEEEFEQFSKPLNKWYRVNVYSPEKNFFYNTNYRYIKGKEKARLIKTHGRFF